MSYNIYTSSKNDTQFGISYKDYKTNNKDLIRLLARIQLDYGGDFLYIADNQNQIDLKNDYFHIACLWQEEKYTIITCKCWAHNTLFRNMLQHYFTLLNEEDNLLIINQINTALKNSLWFDFLVSDFNGFELSVIGSTDLTYYSEIEIMFQNTTFFCCPSYWTSDPSTDLVFSLADENDKERINLQYDVPYDILVKIKPESNQIYYFIGCSDIRFSAGYKKYKKHSNIVEKEE